MTAYERIQQQRQKIATAQAAIHEIAASVIPDYSHRTHKVAFELTCNASPLVFCVWDISRYGKYKPESHCYFCGETRDSRDEPEEYVHDGDKLRFAVRGNGVLGNTSGP